MRFKLQSVFQLHIELLRNLIFEHVFLGDLLLAIPDRENNTGSCGMIEMALRSRFSSNWEQSKPSIMTWPELILNSRVRTTINDDLPAPVRPQIPI